MTDLPTLPAAREWLDALPERWHPGTGWWLEPAWAGYDPETDLYCAACVEAAAERLGRDAEGECWAGDDSIQHCAACGRVIDTGGLTGEGVAAEGADFREEALVHPAHLMVWSLAASDDNEHRVAWLARVGDLMALGLDGMERTWPEKETLDAT